jgi:signal transduction histidine kinase
MTNGLSREIHDGLAQTLGYLSMEMERLERRMADGQAEVWQPELAALRRDVAEAYLDVREAIDGLRLPIDQPGGVAHALRELVANFRERTGLTADCVFSDIPENVPPEIALHLLRIVQEALANVRQHARARHVRVQFTRGADGLMELIVADDGRGFDPSLPQERRHHGLATMRERVRSLGGQFSLATSPGQGTRLVARVPM